MLGPFDPVNITAGVAANLATSILQHYSEQLHGTAFGRALAKIGLLKPDFSDRMHSALTLALDEYFTKHPKYRVKGVLDFFSNVAVAKDIGDTILNGEPIDIDGMVTLLGDCLDLPANTPPAAWPFGFDPRELFRDFLGQLDICLGRDADPGVVWISRQLADLRSVVDGGRTELTALRKDMPALFDLALATKQTKECLELEQRFLSHIRHRFGRLTTPGARELHGVNQRLSIAYISLNVKSQAKGEPIRAEQFLLENPLIIVRGQAGSGKTTLLNWIAWCCSEQNERASPWQGGVPFFIPLRTVARTEVGAPRVSNFVQYSVDAELWSTSTPEGWVDDVLRHQKRGIVMIDGVDELPPPRRAGFWEWLSKFIVEYPDNRVVVTSRTLPGSLTSDGIEKTEHWNPPAGFVDAHLEDMSNADITRFVEHWHDAVDPAKLDEFEHRALLRARDELPKKLEDPANRRIRELCSTPLLCAMVCVLHWREEGYLPRQRVDLYGRCCDMLIEARDLKRGIQPPSGALAFMTKNDKEMVLQRLAFDMLRNKPDSDEVHGSTYRIEITREKAVGWISARISSFQNAEARQCTADEVLDHLIERTGLLREPASGLVDFPHRTFQEYLAACAAGAEGQEEFLAKQANDDQWHETIMLAAGTTTGGVGFGRALIEALIKRAERNVSNRPSSQRIRKTCFALALGGLENLRQQDPSLRDSVLAHLAELVPPRNEGDARILSVAGDAAVPHLQYSKWKDERTSTVSVCAQALRLIGTTGASRALSDGYVSDNRDPVVAEVCRVGSIEYAKIPLVVGAVAKSGVLPGFAPVRDIALLVGIPGLKRLAVSSPLPRNIDRISELGELEAVTLERVHLSELQGVSWPNSIREINLLSCSTSDFAWLKHLKVLERLSVLAMPISDLTFVRELKQLTSLRLLGLEVPDLSPLIELRSLKELSLERCKSVVDLSPLSKVRELRALRIEDCPNLGDLAPIGDLTHLSDLSVGGLRDSLDLAPLSKLSNLTNVRIAAMRRVRSLTSLTGLPITRLLLSNLPDVRDLGALEHLPSIRALSIRALSNLARLPSFSELGGLREFTLDTLPALRNIDGIGEASGLTELTIEDCARLQDFSQLSKLQHLKELRLRELPKLDDPSFLRGKQALTHLELRRCTEVADLSVIAHLKELTRLHIYGCPKVKDVSPISSLPRLVEVALLDCNGLADVSPLANLTQLQRLRLSETESKKILIPEPLLPKVVREQYYVPSRYWRYVDAQEFRRWDLRGVSWDVHELSPWRSHHVIVVERGGHAVIEFD